MTTSPQFRLREASVFSRQVKTRMPFRFGRATMTQMPIIHLRLKLESGEGELIEGAAACGIPPLWFDKAAGKTHADNIQDLLVSLRLALDEYMLMDAAPVWFLHKVAEPPVRKMAAAKGLNGLTAGFGVALVDSALIDAACRQARVSFHGALKANLFGYGGRLAELLP
ncbi:MAG: mandelate racemase, partial [Fibrobacteria bacterium]